MFRPKIFLTALRAAGRSVGRAESETRDFKKMGRSVRTQSSLSTSHSQDSFWVLETNGIDEVRASPVAACATTNK